MDHTPPDEALTRFERLVILGEAGQGKTTLLQWLTVQCGRGAFTADKAPWNDKVPVLIKLREVLNHPILPTVCDFYSLMVQNITPEQPHQDWFNTILAAKQAILMIDGFDEVPQSDRARVLNWINRTLTRITKPFS